MRPVAPLALVVCAALLSACGGSPTAPKITRIGDTPVDSISIVAAQPAAGSVLRRGSTVEFYVSVSYDLQTAPNGAIFLVIQDQTGRSIQPTQPFVNVRQGAGRVELWQSLMVPIDADRVDLFVPMANFTSASTRVVARVEYRTE